MQNYAYSMNAFYGALKRRGDCDLFVQDILRFRLMVSDSPSVEVRILGANITRASRIAVISTIIEPFFSPVFTAFLIRLVDNGDIARYPELAARFLEVVSRRESVQFVPVISCTPMRTAQLERVRKRLCELTGAEVIAYNTIDRSILGGFVVMMGNRILDLSIRRDVQRIREALIQGADHDPGANYA